MAKVVSRPGPTWSLDASYAYPRPSKGDYLPPFAALTSNDDRECKAKYEDPGTYFVVANKRTFAKCEGYRIARDHKAHFSDICTEVSPLSPSNSYSSEASALLQQSAEDPNVVILRVFEEEQKNATSPGMSEENFQSTQEPSLEKRHFTSATETFSQSPIQRQYSPFTRIVLSDERDQRLADHYLHVIRKQLAQVHRDSLGTQLEVGTECLPDLLERQASVFPPVGQIFLSLIVCKLKLS